MHLHFFNSLRTPSVFKGHSLPNSLAPKRFFGQGFGLAVVVVFAIAFSSLVSCTDSDPNPPIVNVAFSMSVQVTDESGLPLPNAEVSLGTMTSTTNASGLAVFESAAFPSGRTLLKVNGSGFFPSLNVVEIKASRYSMDVVLHPNTLAGTFLGLAGGSIAVPGGGNVEFGANSVVEASGAAYSGQVFVAATYLAPNGLGNALPYPSDFLGNDASGNSIFLENHGMVSVQLFGSLGQPLQLAGGKTAQISIPVAAQDVGTAPATLPLYYFDEEQVVWKEEGLATLQGNEYVGDVAHFSFWMCPFVYNHYPISGRLVCQGSPLPATQLEVYNQWGAFLGKVSTNANGYFYGMIPSTLSFQFKVKNACQETAAQFNLGPFNGATQLNDLNVCSGTANSVQINGGFEDCNGNPDLGAWARVEAQGVVRLYPSNGQGQVNASVLLCQASSSVSIRGVNVGTGAISTGQTFPLAPSISFGNQVVCNNAPIFCQFTLDGVPYYYTPSSQYTFSCVYTAAQNRLTPGVTYNPGTGNSTTFMLTIPGSTASTYSVGGNPFSYSFLVLGNNGQDYLSVILNQAGSTLGQTVSGSISNTTFRDAGGVQHTLSDCSFQMPVTLVN
jgi:hypothetical protein